MVNVEHPLQHFLEWEISAQGFGIDGVFLFFELIAVVAPVPHVDFRGRILRVSRFHLLQLQHFAVELGLNSGDQIVDILFRIRACLGHFDFGLEIVP